MMKFVLFAFLLFVIYTIASRSMSRPQGMRKDDAARLLGVRPDAGPEAVMEAHRRLIGKVHPDAGGSAELAAQINQARDTLLKP
jgi:DnaJ homolog subfamily C member 19